MMASKQNEGVDSRALGLRLVHSAIVKVLERDDTIDAVFGSPVDISLLPDYNSIIKRPRDLGTISRSIEESLGARGPYASYAEALADVQLVWKNCLRYNDRPEDTEIVSLCMKGRDMFKSALKEVCAESGVRLVDGPVKALLDEPPRFLEEEQEGALPLEDIQDFEIISAGDGEAVDLLTLGEMRSLDEAVLISGSSCGSLMDAEPSRKYGKVDKVPVIDWAIDFAVGSVQVWVITKHAWYRLNNPTKEYQDVYKHVLDASQTIEEAIDIAELQETLDIKQSVSEAVKRKRGKCKISAHVKKFALGHLEALYGQRKETYSMWRMSFGLEEDPDYEAISDDDIPDDFDLDDEEFDIEEFNNEEIEKARRKAWRKNKYNVQKKTRQDIMDAKSYEADRLGHENRGSPPDMSVSFRLPGNKIHEVLFLWSFLQEFGDILRLPPFTLRTLEASLCPGPSISVTIKDHHEAVKHQQIQVNGDIKEEEGGNPSKMPVKKECRENSAIPGQKQEEIIEGSEMQVEMKQDTIAEGEENEQKNLPSSVEQGTSSSDGNKSLPKVETADKSGLDDTKSYKHEIPMKESMHEANDTKLCTDESALKPPQINGISDNGGADKNDMMIDKFTSEKDAVVEPPPVKVKRGRGRPRKDGSAPQPRPHTGLPKVAPQNLVLDPTVRTRRQRGVTVTSKKLDEYALDIDEILKDEEFRPMQRKKIVKPKTYLVPVQPYQSDDGPNKISEAIKNSQKIQEEYEANLKRKYGVSSEVLKFGAPVDKYYAPSGILVRDIVLALLGVIDETLPSLKGDLKRPTSASTFLPSRNQKSIWPEAAANNVWSWDGIWGEAKDAALHLAYGDFVDLSIDEKIEILCGLLYEAIESKFISAEISKRADKCLQQQATRDASECSKPHGRDLAEKILHEMEYVPLEEGDTSSISGKNMKDWARWIDLLGLGTKTCIGEDFGGRRYWALGKESGAFRIFCQEIRSENGIEKDCWGWYEGAKLGELLHWLKLADIRSERPLIAALSTAPSPIDFLSSKPWKNNDLENQRADGYRNISQPLLRGEWNHCNGKPLPLGVEQRVSQAIESILGSITFWFEDMKISKQIYGISDMILSMQPKASARALLEADKLLISAGKVTQEWIDIWSPKWRISVVSIIDVRDVALHIAALQSHVIMQADVIPRGTYLKILEDLNCVLTIPLPSDSIAVMKTGILMHIDKAMELLGIMDEQTPGSLTGADFEHRDTSMPDVIDAESHILPLKDSSRASIRSQWTSLRDKVSNMKYIEQYIVRGIIYRKHLVDYEHVSTDGFTIEELALMKKPVAWLYLKPVEYGIQSQLSSTCMMVPIVLDKGLKDYYMPLDTFKKRMSVDWCNNDRFKLFIPPTPAQRRSKSVGFWKKGTVVENLTEANTSLDPWESIVVEFDNTPVGETTRASPWKLEIDPDEEKTMVEEARKMEQAVARSQRARSSMRSPDEDEAKLQESEWAEEDNQLQLTLRQAKRSEHLLQLHNSSSHTFAGEVHNDSFYSVEEKGKYYTYLSEIGSDMYIKYSTMASKNRSKGDARSVNNAFPSGPLVPGQQVNPKILEALRMLTKEQFMMLLKNFYIGLKGRFKIPIFAHRELDLFVVWWSVMDRFGYETVTTYKQWKDICRALDIDLSGQTSASFNMRMNYERCLLDFENYLACGQYEIDLAAGKAPVHTHAMNPSTTRFFIPGAYDDQLDYIDTPLMPSLPSDNDNGEKIPTSTSPTLQEADDSVLAASKGVSPIISLKGAISRPKSTLIKLKQPDRIDANASQDNLGSRIKSSGSAAIGMSIELYWPSEGGWWRAEIIDFDLDTHYHQILYNRGLPDESFEWIDMASLSSEELRLTKI